jgi:preprotein translocase subunit SecF
MKQTNNTPRFDFVKLMGPFGGLSLVAVIASVIYLAGGGINYGIDFSGGTEVQVKFAQEVTIDQVRASAGKLNLTSFDVQKFEGDHEYVVRFQAPKGADEKEVNDLQNKQSAALSEALKNDFAAQGAEIRRVDSVGPAVGDELRRNGFLSVFYSLLVILIYVALRFDYKYSPGAVICLFHDAVVTLAVFNLMGKEVNLPILAAILTLIGYSLNDTIVVFDRIRETESEHRREGFRFVINKAVNDMLGRTIITALTTFMSTMTLWYFADGTVKDIAFALSVGIVAGTYSSIYVAAPFVLLTEKLSKLRKPVAAKA